MPPQREAAEVTDRKENEVEGNNEQENDSDEQSDEQSSLTSERTVHVKEIIY